MRWFRALSTMKARHGLWMEKYPNTPETPGVVRIGTTSSTCEG